MRPDYGLVLALHGPVFSYGMTFCSFFLPSQRTPCAIYTLLFPENFLASSSNSSHTVWYGMVWYGMVWYGMVWYGMVWYGMVWYGMVWYGMVWYGMVWYGMVWYVKFCFNKSFMLSW